MKSVDLIQSFAEFKDQKSIDISTMKAILEDVFRAVLIKNYGSDENYDIIINVEKGDFEIYRNLEIVADGEVEDANRQIELSKARLAADDFELGEEYTEEIKFEQFARRNILAIRQNLSSRIAELDRNNLFNLYKKRIGSLVVAEVYQIRKREIILHDEEDNELILQKNDQIPSDHFRKGDTVRAVVDRVEVGRSAPLVFVSRTAPRFLECLMELEVPEIFDGLITIKKVVRVPGERAKVAVESYDDRVDPVGACVGMKGARIHGIVRELRNENIDVISYTSNAEIYVAKALSPAKLTKLEINEETRTAEVYLEPEEVSKAIGKGGYNIRLASELTGYKIDVFRELESEQEDDYSLEEFADEIEPWIIDILKSVGCDTARSVLKMSPEFLVQRTDLEEETIYEVLQILQREFE
ncbi:MAG: transcription termination factor NusA [Bacteroides sp.]|jgi:transcription termination factor nusA